MLFDQSAMMVFPGQGSQRIGMLSDYAELFPCVKHAFDTMSDICSIDLWQITQQGPVESLNDTRITQPAMFAADIAIWKAWEQSTGGAMPLMVAGHSLGEYAALVCSGILSFKDAGMLVKHRARLMAEAVPDGEGAVGVIIKATLPEVEQWCLEASGNDQYVSVANINSPIQLVVAGHKAAVEKVLQIAKQNKAKMARLLPVSVPVHCSLLKPAADEFRQYFKEVTFHHPRMPMVFNVDGVCHYQPKNIEQALYEQLFKPVQWLKTMDILMQNKPAMIVESGPGGVLTGLFNRTFKQSDCRMISLNNVTDLQEVCQHGE